jgi:hypothetical protein
VPPGFRLACYQEMHAVAPCEALPYKPLAKWYKRPKHHHKEF